MDTIVIVGGGLSGLLVARELANKGVDFVGLEKSTRLGGRLEVGHHRVYASKTVDYFRERFPNLQWTHIVEKPRERKRGEWSEVNSEYCEEERFYLGEQYFAPERFAAELLNDFTTGVSERYRFQTSVIEIHPDEKRAVCQDGIELKYNKLFWCSPLESLSKVWKGDKLKLAKALKGYKERRVGVAMDWELTGEEWEGQATVSVPFRFKSETLRALGVQHRVGQNGDQSRIMLNWILFLDPETSEDKEEVAKRLRTMKREILKEFPLLKDKIKSERIAYFSTLSGESPIEVASLEVLEGVFYVGPEARLQDSDVGLRNLDRIVDNCRLLNPVIC